MTDEEYKRDQIRLAADALADWVLNPDKQGASCTVPIIFYDSVFKVSIEYANPQMPKD